MYIPKQFAENDPTILQAAIKSLQFATIITLNDTSLSASHIPMLIDDTAGKLGTLEGHIARANPQGSSYTRTVPALAIFTGPNAYISPSWYATKKEHGKAVPTWNYIAVHASGPLEIVEDRNWLLDHVNRLTNRNEQRREQPWKVSDAPEQYIDNLIGSIVGLRMPIEKIEGSWKMIQHHVEGNREGVIKGLTESGTPKDLAVAQIMQELENKQ